MGSLEIARVHLKVHGSLEIAWGSLEIAWGSLEIAWGQLINCTAVTAWRSESNHETINE